MTDNPNRTELRRRIIQKLVHVDLKILLDWIEKGKINEFNKVVKK